MRDRDELHHGGRQAASGGTPQRPATAHNTTEPQQHTNITMPRLSEDATQLFVDIYIACKGDINNIRTLLFEKKNTPAHIFSSLQLFGPEYEKKGKCTGKHYATLRNWRCKWKGEGVLEDKILQYVPPSDVINRFEVPAPAAPSVIRSAADLVRGAPAAAGDHAAGLPSVPPVPLTPDVAQRSGSSSSGGIDGNLNPSTPHMTYDQLAGLFQLSNQQTNQLSQVMAEENQRTNQQFGQCFRAITHVSGRVDNLEDRFERYAYTNGSRVAKLERQVRALTPQKKTKKRK